MANWSRMSSGFGILPEWLTLWFVFNTTFLVNSMCLAESLLPIAFVIILFSPFPVVITAKLVFDFGTKPVSQNYQDISNTPGKSLVDNLGFWYSGDISTKLEQSLLPIPGDAIRMIPLPWLVFSHLGRVSLQSILRW